MEETISVASAILIGLIAAVAGAILGGGTVLVVIRAVVSKLKQDVPWQDAIEKLYMSVPVVPRTTIRDIVETMKEAADLADKVTDAQPNAPIALQGRAEALSPLQGEDRGVVGPLRMAGPSGPGRGPLDQP